MKPYYEDESVTIYHGDFRDVEVPGGGVVVTDPPYNMGYHYESYSDDLTQHEYLNLLERSMDLGENNRYVMVNYPELSTSLAVHIGHAPKKIVSWVYSANTPRQWRAVSWYFLSPDLSLSGQPYKNPTDKRVAERIANGEQARLYDWWYEDQVKNVSGEKTSHPCQIPESLMKRILTVTPAELYIDPFMGSGTTLRAAKDLGKKAVGIELEERYCEIAANRMAQTVMQL